MRLESLLSHLVEYQPSDIKERAMRDRIRIFMGTTPEKAWSRTNFKDGHLVASAWIVNTARTHALLLYHEKIGKWVQPGGHIEEEDFDIESAARREVMEETGLTDLKLCAPLFDIDVHVIPARGEEPAHSHYDIRVLFEVADSVAATYVHPNGEVVRFVALDDIRDLTTEESVLRMKRKTAALSPDGTL